MFLVPNIVCDVSISSRDKQLNMLVSTIWRPFMKSIHSSILPQSDVHSSVHSFFHLWLHHWCNYKWKKHSKTLEEQTYYCSNWDQIQNNIADNINHQNLKYISIRKTINSAKLLNPVCLLLHMTSVNNVGESDMLYIDSVGCWWCICLQFTSCN